MLNPFFPLFVFACLWRFGVFFIFYFEVGLAIYLRLARYMPYS